jgi:hypothetical protein
MKTSKLFCKKLKLIKNIDKSLNIVKTNNEKKYFTSLIKNCNIRTSATERLYYFKWNFFSTTSININKLSNTENIENESTNDIERFNFQDSPIYEAALSNFLNGDFEKMRNLLTDLISEFKKNENYQSIEYIELLFRVIDLNKSSRFFSTNLSYITEILGISKKVCRGDFTIIYTYLSRSIKYLRDFHPKECLEIINEYSEFLPYIYKEFKDFNLGVSIK